ncbi:uncharacterized protein LOC144007860 isoform X2 [Festucalex cinctus]
MFQVDIGQDRFSDGGELDILTLVNVHFDGERKHKQSCQSQRPYYVTSSPETYLSRKKRDAHSLTSDSIASSSSTCCSTRSCNTLTRIATKSKRRFPEGGNLQIEPKMADLLCVSTWTHKQTSLYQVFLNVSFLSTGSHLQHNGQIDCKNGRMQVFIKYIY